MAKLPWLRFLVVVLLVLADQWSKGGIFQWLAGLEGSDELVRDIHGHRRYVILDPWFSVFRSCNSGSAFGMFQGHTGWLVAGRILAVSALLVVLFRARADHRMVLSAMVLVVAGAVGNLLDNLWFGCPSSVSRWGEVRDFIDVWFVSADWGWDYHFPTFNVADSCISVGAVLWILSGFFHHGEPDDQPETLPDEQQPG